MTRPSIEARGLTVALQSNVVLEDLSFSHRGQGLVQVLGPNGAGKSTLLKTIAGVIRPLRGRVLVNGSDVTGNPRLAGQYIGYLPQEAGEAYSGLPLTAWEIVESEALLRRGSWPRIGLGDGGRSRLVAQLLSLVGLRREAWHRRFDRLSGGEKQRVLLARALVHDPPVLLLDEPLAPIDPVGRASMARLIGGLSRDKLVLVTSHDPGLLMEYTMAVLLLNRTVYFYGAPDEVLRLESLRAIYGESVQSVGDHLHIGDTACRGG